ncbi:MAG: hypothetical protein ACOCRK_01570 [bacterium]
MDRKELLNDIAKELLKVSLDNEKYSEVIKRMSLRLRIKVLQLLLETNPDIAEELKTRINNITDELNDNEELRYADNEFLKQWNKNNVNIIDGLDYEKILRDKIKQISVRSG